MVSKSVVAGTVVESTTDLDVIKFVVDAVLVEIVDDFFVLDSVDFDVLDPRVDIVLLLLVLALSVEDVVVFSRPRKDKFVIYLHIC